MLVCELEFGDTSILGTNMAAKLKYYLCGSSDPSEHWTVDNALVLDAIAGGNLMRCGYRWRHRYTDSVKVGNEVSWEEAAVRVRDVGYNHNARIDRVRLNQTNPTDEISSELCRVLSI